MLDTVVAREVYVRTVWSNNMNYKLLPDLILVTTGQKDSSNKCGLARNMRTFDRKDGCDTFRIQPMLWS